MADILVVDDDPSVRALVEQILARAGHRSRAAGDGSELRRLFAQRAADMVVLDLTLPDEDGLALARWLRGARTDPGILILSALGEPIDRVAGLEAGADDYLGKPFEPEELIGRIEAILRRRRGETAGLRIGGWRIDSGAGLLADADGHTIRLTASELALITAFARSPDRVLSRDELLELAPARGDDAFDRSIDHRIRRLRLKLDPDPQHPTLIRSARGRGYVYRP